MKGLFKSHGIVVKAELTECDIFFRSLLNITLSEDFLHSVLRTTKV